MDTLIKDGDHVVGGDGYPVQISGAEEIIQQALIRLQVRRGSFAEDKQLGSELYKLSGAPQQHLQRLATAYVQQALAAMEEISVSDVQVRHDGIDSLIVDVAIEHLGSRSRLEIIV